MKKIKVEVIKYESDDGKIWDTEAEAEHQDKILSGVRRVCFRCDGHKTVLSEDMIKRLTCPVCKGKGWLQKVELWQ